MRYVDGKGDGRTGGKEREGEEVEEKPKKEWAEERNFLWAGKEKERRRREGGKDGRVMYGSGTRHQI